MVELARDLRGTDVYGSGDFKTFSVDCGSVEFEALIASEGPNDYLFNFNQRLGLQLIPNYSKKPICEMGIKQVVFFCKAPLESGMANTVQSKVLVLAASKTPESAKKNRAYFR